MPKYNRQFDLNQDEFVAKFNSDIVGKVVNLASRSAKFKKDLGLCESYPDDGGLFAEAANQSADIAAAYEACDFARATRLIMALADRANEFVEKAAPWTLKKDPEKQLELQEACTIALNLFRQLIIYLGPVLPELTQRVNDLFGKDIVHWNESSEHQLGYRARRKPASNSASCGFSR